MTRLHAGIEMKGKLFGNNYYKQKQGNFSVKVHKEKRRFMKQRQKKLIAININETYKH